MTYTKTYNPCDDCPYSFSKNNQESNMCKICEFEQSLDLINRPKAENERLKQERDKEHNHCNHYARMCAKSKSEAYKEFAERLKQTATNATTWAGIEPVVTIEDIDNLLKEMG